MTIFNDLDYRPDLDCLVYDEDPRQKYEKHFFAERVAHAKEKIDYLNYLVSDCNITEDEAMGVLRITDDDLKNYKNLIAIAESTDQK